MDSVEVKRSKKNENIEYIDPFILKDKDMVFSQAHFFRIRVGEDCNKLSLKIGRYKKDKKGLHFSKNRKTEILEVDNPKSELTLDNDELDMLISYINEHYYPLINNEKKYLSLSDETMSELIRKNPDSITQLINIAIEKDFDLSYINNLIEIANRRKALLEFEENLKNDVKEEIWQKWFERNNWVLGTDFVSLSDDRRIDVNNIADFIVENFDGFVDLVEIKRVGESIKFFEAKKDHSNLIPYSLLVKAITQLANYLATLEKKANENDTTNRIGKILKPRGILIYGRSKDWKEKEYEAFRLLNASLTNITIYTYDMVYDRAKKINDYISKESS